MTDKITRVAGIAIIAPHILTTAVGVSVDLQCQQALAFALKQNCRAVVVILQYKPQHQLSALEINAHIFVVCVMVTHENKNSLEIQLVIKKISPLARIQPLTSTSTIFLVSRQN